MKLIKAAAAVLNQTPIDWEGNKKNILDAIQEAKSQKISILCLPELCITGYGCEDAFYSPNVHRVALQILQEIAPYTKDIIVSVGLPILFQNKIFNTACMLADGKIMGFTAKQFLAGDGVYYEPRWFKPWIAGEIAQIEIDGDFYPLGDIYFDVGGVKIGFEICEDAWVANRPGRFLFEYGIDIILNPSASNFAFDKVNIRKRFVLEGSRSFGVGYLYSNILGNDSGRLVFDGSCLIASEGKLIAEGKRFSFANYEITSAYIDVDANRLSQIQSNVPFKKPADIEQCVFLDFEFPEIPPQQNSYSIPEWENSPFIKEEEFSRALALALFDYLRKSYSRGFVISLS
ncbi:MAG: nitrilase-related carbon-nitrogen hydrolase, partial [Bacteroidota bacterium]